MKVKIETEIARLTVDLTEGQVADILGLALDYATGLYNIPKEDSSESTLCEEYVNCPPAETVKAKDIESHVTYKGFLYLKCESCGKFKGFMPKKPISYHHCDCGHDTDLHDLKVMYAECKCGETYKYLTNADDPIIIMDCLVCGAPIDIEYIDRHNVYQTMK